MADVLASRSRACCSRSDAHGTDAPDAQSTSDQEEKLVKKIEACRPRVDKLQHDAAAASGHTEFLGQASVELDALLSVLDGDGKSAEDIAPFLSEDAHDIGVLLAKFQFVCDHESSCTTSMVDGELPSSQVRYEREDDAAGVHEDLAYEYPATSSLQLSWNRQEPLQKGDRTYLVREDLEAKFSRPFIILLWWTNGGGDQGEWWAPNSFRAALASASEDSIDELHGKESPDRSGGGCVRLPSSFALNLPPGVYRVYLMRSEREKGTGDKKRIVLGRTDLLAVIPGANSVHTCFGTTPVVGVRSVSAVLHPTGGDSGGYHGDPTTTEVTKAPSRVDSEYSRDLRTIEQELEVARLDLELASYEASQSDQVPPALKVKVVQLSKIVQDLHQESDRLVNRTSTDSGNADGAPRVRVYTQSPTLASGSHASFGFRLQGGTPQPGDHLVLMREEVAQTADLLRTSILGKLQENDLQELATIRSELEQKPHDVKYRLDVYRNRFAPWKWAWLRQGKWWRRSEWWWTVRSLVPRIGTVAVLSGGESNDSCWLQHEC